MPSSILQITGKIFLIALSVLQIAPRLCNGFKIARTTTRFLFSFNGFADQDRLIALFVYPFYLDVFVIKDECIQF